MGRAGPNSSDVIQGKLRSREKLAEEQRLTDLADVMGSAAGRRFIYDLLFERCGLMSLYPGADSGVYRNEGRRQVGWYLAQDIQRHSVELYLLMINEHVSAQADEDGLRKAALASEETDE